MDIEIKDPIEISMDVLEIDEHLPSMKFTIIINVRETYYSMAISSEIWVECSVFDAFVNSLKRKNKATLIDMDNLFQLVIEPTQLAWCCSKINLDGRLIQGLGEASLTNDIQQKILDVFEDYPKWW